MGFIWKWDTWVSGIQLEHSWRRTGIGILLGTAVELGHLAHTAPVRQDCARAHVTDGLKMREPSETGPASLPEPVLVFQGWDLSEQIFSGPMRIVWEDA